MADTILKKYPNHGETLAMKVGFLGSFQKPLLIWLIGITFEFSRQKGRSI
jgi:hypothetical protein